MLFRKQPEPEWRTLSNGTRIHKTAVIGPFVHFGDNCVVHPYSVVGKYPDTSSALARIPSNTITNHIHLGNKVIIGCGVVIYVNVIIGSDCLIGDRANIREGVYVGSKCSIGCGVDISYNVKIGDRCRFQNGTIIVGDTHIGNDCFFGVNVTTSNDRNVDLGDYHFPHPPQPSVFGNKVMVGSGANVLAGCKIGDGVVIGAGALVVTDVEDDKVYLSLPAQEYVR